MTLGTGGLGIVQATTSSGERSIYKPINPCRLLDIRPAPRTVGPRTSPLGPAETYTIDGWGAVGDCVLPTGTTALALNVTAVGASAGTYLRLWPADGDQPGTANLNPAPGAPPTPNAVNVKLSADGKFSIYNNAGSVNVVIDVVGVYDDHNHDDRYYSKAQVDDLLAPLQAKLATLENPVAVTDTNPGITSLSTLLTLVASVSLVPEFDGQVLAASTGYAYQTSAAKLVARCYLTPGMTSENGVQQYVNVDQGQFGSDVIAGTRLLPAQAGVPITINLLCNSQANNTGSVAEVTITAVLFAS